ncbi:hypothetical protein DI487_10610 [Flavobacterium sediminis]|uniref:CUB domain-containing protein n=1 Tax=Flavobacterium sediminis TaxID=2201181 RepID=A0A2U8QVM8_9FLAO|nr:GEVED domain-containing protein [Flavobacterium sediminis]AWM14260.1 hypothetical protein DI487_10610 [Flavobacterium sediminis]
MGKIYFFNGKKLYFLLLLTITFQSYSQYQVPRNGNNTISTCSGTISDSGGSGNYQNNSNGYTVITPSVAGNYIQISGSITAEAGYDYLTIYDGNGTGGTVLWGGSPQGSGTSCSTTTIPTITSTTGSLTVHFYADGSNRCSGFNLNINCSATPGSTPVNSYCIPISDNPSGLYITNLAFIGTLSDPPVNTSTYDSDGYQDFTSLTPLAIQAQGEGVNITANCTGNDHLRGTWKAWVDWNNDGDFSDSGELVYDIQGFAGSSVTFGFVIPASQTPGDYRMRIRVNNGSSWLGSETFGFNFSSCDNFEYGSGMFSDDNYGETEDYIFTVIENCSATITDVTNGSTCGSGIVSLNANGSSGTTEYRWYANETGGSPLATTPSGNWNTPNLTSTTTYWVTAYNGSCESVVRTEITALVNPTPTLTFTPSNPLICGENEVLELTTSGDTETVHLIDEDFESGNLGVFTNINNDSNGNATDNKTKFQNRTSVHVPSTNVWFPAISSGFGTNKFALALSDASSPDYPSSTVQNFLALSNSVNSTDFLDLTLKLKLYYSRYYTGGANPTNEYVAIELSTDGGATYPVEIDNFTSNVGIGTRFVTLSYDLSAYINQPNLKIRVRHHSYAGSGWLPDGVAVDNIELYGTKPLNTAFDWTSALPINAYQDFACTIPYTSGTPAVNVFIKPTLAQLEQSSYTFTVSAILSNGCYATDDITVTNNSKIWNGSNSTNWSDPDNWLPSGVPTIDNCVIIPDNVVVDGNGYDAFAKNLKVKSTGNMNTLSNNSITVKEWVDVDAGGIVNLENASSLIQIDNIANNGVISMKRNAEINLLSYVYWSTPVANFSSGNISPATPNGFIWKWNPTINNGGTYAGNFGNWINGNETMANGKGYIVKGPNGYTTSTQTFTATFTGTPNNGDINVPIKRGTYVGSPYTGPTTTPVTQDDDNWNLLGNPYPSAISTDAFLTANSTHLTPFVKIWTHGVDPAPIANPFYGSYQLNYDVADYMTYNSLGGTQAGFDGYIGAGQGFFVLMNDAASTNETVIFNNSMRSNVNRNDQFYRASQSQINERHRIWLKMISPTGQSSDALVGYATGAATNFDPKFDAPAMDIKTNFELYSIADTKKLAIQGRALPFDLDDTIPLGITIPQNGSYTIAISNIDGIFNSQDIYLEDLSLGIIHDLKVSPYSFSSNSGTFDNRFILRFTNSLLSTETFNSLENDVKIFATENTLRIEAPENIQSVVVYDILGKTLFTGKYSETSISIHSILKTNNTILVKTVLADGTIINKKVIY